MAELAAVVERLQNGSHWLKYVDWLSSAQSSPLSVCLKYTFSIATMTSYHN
jgi:hypothetical protein